MSTSSLRDKSLACLGKGMADMMHSGACTQWRTSTLAILSENGSSPTVLQVKACLSTAKPLRTSQPRLLPVQLGLALQRRQNALARVAREQTALAVIRVNRKVWPIHRLLPRYLLAEIPSMAAVGRMALQRLSRPLRSLASRQCHHLRLSSYV